MFLYVGIEKLKSKWKPLSPTGSFRYQWEESHWIHNPDLIIPIFYPHDETCPQRTFLNLFPGPLQEQAQRRVYLLWLLSDYLWALEEL